MLDLFVTPAVAIVDEALASAKAGGKIAVVGSAKLAKALGAKAGREVVAVDLPPRAAKKVAGAVELGALAARSVDAVVGVEADDTKLAAWANVVRDGGLVVTVDRAHAAEASRRALCGGLTELQQRHAGRFVVTSGLVSHL